MSKRRATDPSLRRWITPFLPSKEGNLKVVVLCIIAATTFWFFSALNKSDYTTQINYPVNFLYPTDSTYPLSQLPEDVRLQVNGGGWDLLRKTLLVNVQPIEITLDEPTKVKYITGQSLAEDIEASLGDVRLDYILTDTLRINIDSVMAKEVTIVVDSGSVSLEENHRIISPVSLDPRTAKVVGPASVIRQAPDTLVIEIPDREIADDYDESILLSYTSPMAEVVPDETNVKFEVTNFVSFKQSVPLVKRNFPADSSVSLTRDKVEVTFWVEEALVDDVTIDSADFRVVVDLNRAKPDSTLIPFFTKRPDFARNMAISPNPLKLQYEP